jgi:hypothetical protein
MGECLNLVASCWAQRVVIAVTPTSHLVRSLVGWPHSVGSSVGQVLFTLVPLFCHLFILHSILSDYCRFYSFSHFYGPPKVDDSSVKQDKSFSSLDDNIHGGGEAPESDTSAAAACEMNKKCSKLELVGYCCPAENGVMLECCH